MKKIDLHIHTKASPIKDAHFEFDINKLIEYIKVEALDAIAITNHNLFDKEQFLQIIKRVEGEGLDIKIFPGVEIDLENGHLLYITKENNIDYINEKCCLLESKIKTENDSITFDDFSNIFDKYMEDILIPHGEGKKPIISNSTIKKFGDLIQTTEVPNQTKFSLLKTSKVGNTPVLFSDIRITNALENFPKRFTYVDLESLSIDSLKAAFLDKNKVHINADSSLDNTFVIDELGTKASTGINVVLGSRASGKTYLMNKINSIFSNVKYVKQFELMDNESDSKAKYSRSKNNWILEETTSYLEEYKKVLDKIGKIDIESDNKDIEKYIKSLISNASETDQNNEFSKAKMYNEDLKSRNSTTNLKLIINAIVTLLNTEEEYKKIINSKIDDNSLKLLLNEFISKYRIISSENIVIDHVNETIEEIKEKLEQKTNVTLIKSLDELVIAKNKLKVKLFNNYTKKLREKGIFRQKKIHDFKMVAYIVDSSEVNNSLLKEINNNKGKLSNHSKYFNSPYTYLKSLMNDDVINYTNLPRLLIPTNVKILNTYDKDVSGGEQSEFNLLNTLQDAYLHDMLIIDEPESSFDNVFLNEKVNSMIQEISKEMPVFVVTHNNSIGASIKPARVIFTELTINNDLLDYQVYSGKPQDEYLTNARNLKVENYLVQMNSLEGGEKLYIEREKIYRGITKNG